MSKSFSKSDAAEDEEESIPLYNLHSRQSVDSTRSSAFSHILSNDASSPSSSTSSLSISSHDHSQPPIDGGQPAWLCLLGCWLIEAMIWGFPLSFGIFEEYYSQHLLFKSHARAVPSIGTLATGLSYLGMPFINPFILAWPQHRKLMAVAGWVACTLGLVGASFATEVWHLVFFQGVVYGLGWVVCYTPLMFVLNEWFVMRRGLAYGILFGASGVSGLVIPVGVGWMLEKFGFRTALRVYALLIFVVGGAGMFLVRPRSTTFPGTEKKTKATGTDRGVGILKTIRPLTTNAHFVLFALAIFIQGLAFFLPNVYLPSFASALNLSQSKGSLLLALISFSQILGQIFQGWISDRVSVHIPLSISALIPGLGSLLLWGPAKDMRMLVPFALIWGFFSASYSVLFTRVCSFLVGGSDREHDGDRDGGHGGGDDGAAMLLYGFFSFERGISNILEGPVSSWLVGGEDMVELMRYGIGRYFSVVWFTTACMLLGSVISVAGFLKPAVRSKGG